MQFSRNESNSLGFNGHHAVNETGLAVLICCRFCRLRWQSSASPIPFADVASCRFCKRHPDASTIFRAASKSISAYSCVIFVMLVPRTVLPNRSVNGHRQPLQRRLSDCIGCSLHLRWIKQPLLCRSSNRTGVAYTCKRPNCSIWGQSLHLRNGKIDVKTGIFV